MKHILATLTCVGLLGCATASSDPSQSHKAVPADHIHFTPAVADAQKAATVQVMRDSRVGGAVMTTTLTMDGQEMAEVRNGQAITFKVDPGEHILGIKFLGNSPAGGLSLGLVRPKRWAEAATVFEPGKTYIFRVVSNANWEWDLKRSSQ